MHPVARRMALGVQHWLRGFDQSAARHLDAKLSEQRSPILLIGAPRTGSTLFFQLLVRQFRVSYISNAMAAAPRFMVRLCRFAPRTCVGFNDCVRKSEFGFVPGLLAPNEAGQVMRDWFGADASDESAAWVRATVAAITAQADAALFLKNQSNTIRLTKVQRIFPGARMLLLRRDLRWTAQSLLVARRRLHGDDRQWWSVQPPGWESVAEREPVYQVLWQAAKLEQIALAACAAAPHRAAVVDYEELCARPAAVMTGIGERFGLEPTGLLPPQLSTSERRRLSERDWDRLEALYQRHFSADAAARNRVAAPLRIPAAGHERKPSW